MKKEHHEELMRLHSEKLLERALSRLLEAGASDGLSRVVPAREIRKAWEVDLDLKGFGADK